jgi:isopentenyl phosphate kinase
MDPKEPNRPVIVKLGGSIITRKKEVERLRPKILARLARELTEAAGSAPLVVLHGAGSFGHPGAKRWKLAEPPEGSGRERDRLRGASIVAAEVRRLHGKVLAALIEAGANPISLPASTLAHNSAGRLAGLDSGPFARALAAGGMPVSFGDVVPDDAWGFSILSADTIAVELARALGASRVLFVSDVPGILESMGGGPRRVIGSVTEEVARALAPSTGTDVTGGIAGKARAMLAIASAGADAGLISGLSDGAVPRAVRGELVYGSWAKAAR